MRTSEGLRSCGAMFFLIRDWFLDRAEPCLLVLEMDVARDMEAASWWRFIVVKRERGSSGYFIFAARRRLTSFPNSDATRIPFIRFFFYNQPSPRLELNLHHECWCTKPRHLPRRHARSPSLPVLSQPQHLNLTLVFFFPVARKIPFDDPNVLNYVRIAYVAAQIIILGVYFYTSFIVCSFLLSLYPSFIYPLSDQAKE
jgi:Phosphate transport (Pho88)